MAKITPIYQFYTHEAGDVLYAYNDEDNMVTTDNEIGGLYKFIGEGVRVGWEVTKLVTDNNYSAIVNEAIRNEQIELFDGYLASSDSYLGRRISTMLMEPARLCAVSTTSNLSASYNNANFTLTNNSTQQALVIDSYTLKVNDYVLVKNQTNQLHNGIYFVTNVGSSTTNWVLTRDTLLNDSDEFKSSRESSTCYWVLYGNSNFKTIWTLDIDKDTFVLNTDNILFQNAFEQCVRVTTGDGIVGLYKAKTSENVYFRYFSKNIFYVWATASPCLISESKTQIVSPEVPDFSFDTYNVAVYLASVQVNDKFSSNNLIVDSVEYDDRRNKLLNLEGVFEAAIRKAFSRHVHSGTSSTPSKIKLSTSRVLFASGPVGTTIFETFDENGTRVFSWDATIYGFPEVRLNGQLLPESAYSLNPSSGRIFLKNSLLKESTIQITLPLSPQKKLTAKPPSLITDSIINLTDNLNSSGNALGGTGGSDPRLFIWDAKDYLEPAVYVNQQVVSSIFYVIKPDSGTITFKNFNRTTNDTFYIILERIGREITGFLNSSRLQTLNASLFTKNELDIKRIAPLDHVGLVRALEPAFLKPTKRLLSSGDKIRFFPEDVSQDLQFTTEIHKISTSVNRPNVYLFGTKRGLFDGTSLSKINFSKSWNPDNGEIIDFQDDIMRSVQVHVSANKFKTMYVLTKQGFVYKSFDQGSSWTRLKMPFFSGSALQIKATAFLVSTQIEPYTVNTEVKYRYSTLLYMGTNFGLFTAVIQEGQSDSDWTWSDAWGNITGEKYIYAIGEVVTQRSVTVQGSGTTYYYDRTIYIGSSKGFSIHSDTGAYVASKLVNSEPAKGFLWIKGASVNNLLWFTDNKIYITHTARKVDIQSDESSSSLWNAPLSEFSTTRYSNANKIECKFLYNFNLSNFNAAPNLVDGTQLSVGDKILLRSQTNKRQNGIYEVQTVGTGSNGVWTNVSSTFLTSTSKWISITSGDYWVRSVWNFLYSENSVPANGTIDIGTDLLYFEEFYVNPVSESSGSVKFLQAIERTTSNQYFIASETNPWIITDRRIFSAESLYEWDYPLVNKGNWDLANQSQINSLFFNPIASGNIYVACKEGLYVTTTALQLLSVRLTATLSTTATVLLLDNPGKLVGYNTVILKGQQESVVLGINVVSTVINDNTIYTVNITSSPTRNFNALAGNSSVVPLENKREVTNIIWERITKPILSEFFPNIYNEQNLEVSADGSTLLGLVTNFTLNENYQIINFNSSVDLGNSYLYENEFLSYYLEPWDTTATVFVYINDSLSTNSYSLFPNEGKITFISRNSNNDSVKLTILKLNKYLSNTGANPHAELVNSFITGNKLAVLSDILPSGAPGGTTQVKVDVPSNIPLNTTLLDLIYISGGVTIEERITVKVSVNSKTGIREIYLLNSRAENSYAFPAAQTSVHAVGVGFVLGIEDKITRAYSNQTYNFNSVGGANLIQLSTTLKNFKDENTQQLKYPKLFNTFYSEPEAAFAKSARRPPVNALYYDFTVTPADFRNSSSSLFIGIEPSESNSAASPNSIYVIHNPSSSGDGMRLGTDNGIWIYNSSNIRWSKETDLDGSAKIYFIKKSDNSSYLMAGTDLGLFEQQPDNTWKFNPTYPQTVFDHSSGDWGENYTFTAFGKNDGLAFVKIDKKTGQFISDHFDPVDEKNVYGLYKQKFFKLVSDGQGGVKQQLVDALYLCTNVGLFGVCEGSRNTRLSSVLTGREMFGSKPNLVSIRLPNGQFTDVSVKYYKIFNSPKPQKNNQPPTPIIILSSNGAYTVINWRWCDPADPGSADFVVANHNMVGLSCTCFATATEQISDERFIYKIYVGTNIGVFRSYDEGRSFERCERINNRDTAIYDIKSLSPSCILVATDYGLFYSNDEGDTWYKSNETPSGSQACTSIRSPIDLGEYFTGGALAQTFIPTTDTITKVSLYLSRDDVSPNSASLGNVLTVGIYNTILENGSYVPNLSSPVTLNNVSTITLGWKALFEGNKDNLFATKKLTDKVEFDRETFVESTASVGSAGITAIYDMGVGQSKTLDKMIATIFYTQIPTLKFQYSSTGNTADWQTIDIIRLPKHAVGSWEEINWEIPKNAIFAPKPITIQTVGGSDNSTTYTYKVTSVTYLGESTPQTETVSILGNSVLNNTTYNRLSWSPVVGAYQYKVYGRTNGSEKLLATVSPNNPTIFDDKGAGPAVDAASPPTINTTINLASNRFYRLTLQDEIDNNLEVPPIRNVKFSDFRLYLNNIEYLLSEKISASDINYPGFKSFIINASGLSTTTTYALVAKELDSQENEIQQSSNRIIKWIKSSK